MMYTKKELASQLEKMRLRTADTLLVHASAEAVGDVEGGAQTLLDLLCGAVPDGLLVMPTHTFATVNAENSMFDYRTEPSCSGELGMRLLERHGAFRSLHPSHSFAAFGKGAEEFVEGEELHQTPCPRSGCMGKLLDRGGKLLLIGSQLSECTFIHALEEWAQIPDRLSEPELRYIVMRDGSIFFTMVSGYESPVSDISANYGKLEKPLLELGIAQEFRLGDARCLLCDCEEMTFFVSELLILKPDLFGDGEEIEQRLLDAVKI